MTYAVSYVVPGNEEIYKKVKAEIGNDRPPGMIVHLVVQEDAGGLRHTEVWEDKAVWEAFRDGEVEPAINRFLESMGSTEPPPPPAEEELQIVDVEVGAQA